MASLNKVILIGNLGKDPEVISFDNGTKKMTVSLATTERYRDRDGNWQEQDISYRNAKQYFGFESKK